MFFLIIIEKTIWNPEKYEYIREKSIGFTTAESYEEACDAARRIHSKPGIFIYVLEENELHPL